MKRNGTIDMLRLVFAVIIMLHHSRFVLGYDHCVFAGGSLAVEFFFIVSGDLLAQKALDRKSDSLLPEGGDFGTAAFLAGKIRAILPEMLVGWLIGFAWVAAADQLTLSGLWDRLQEYFWEPLLLRMTGIYTDGFNGVTWYLSSMLICMAILYPLTKRYPDMMTKIVSPLAALLLLGYLCRNFDHPRDPSKWLGFTFKGNIRAMAEICLGIAAFRAAERIRRVSFNRLGSGFVTFLELVLYAAYIRYMYLAYPGQKDYLYIGAVWAAVVLTFSGSGLESRLPGGRISRAAAQYNSALFFGHLYISTRLNSFVPGTAGRGTRLGLYVILSLANGAVVWLLALLVRRVWPKLRGRVRALLVQ